MDEARALSAKVMEILLTSLNIKQHLISPYNHGSNKTERYIQTINNMLCKYLEATGDKWPLYVSPCCYAMNTFTSVTLGFSPYEMVFLHEPPDLHDFTINPELEGKTLSKQEYKDTLKARFLLMKSIIKERKEMEVNSQRIKETRKHPDAKGFTVDDIVYLIAPTSSNLQTTSRKLKKEWIGPLRIQDVLDNSHYLVSDLSGNILPIIIHEKRLKQYHINMGKIQEGKLVTLSNSKDLMEQIRLAEVAMAKKQQNEHKSS
jgi:hypothetical protein